MSKALSKECQSKIKAYKADGWSLFDKKQRLEMTLLKHYELVDEEGTYEVSGEVSEQISTKAGKQAAMRAACQNYATIAESQIRDHIKSSFEGMTDKDVEDLEKFYAAYKLKMEKEIEKELTPTYAVYRSNGKNDQGIETFDIQSYFIVKEGAASEARLRAVTEAIKENETAMKHSEEITDFVKEAVKVVR